MQGKDITIYGDGLQTRSFCYVDDIIKGMVKLMAQEKDVAGPVNLGNPNEVSIKTVAGTILELVRSASTLRFLPIPEDDPRRRSPDITLAKKYLNW